jgi:hypothetical protein
VRYNALITVCPCCGHKFGGSLFEGCPSCGSQAVGEPLTRPERELPNYGRAVSLAAFGVVLALAFLVATGVALFTRQPLEFGFWNFMAAGETAAWQLKFIVAPLALLGALFGWRALQSMRNNPRFAGLPAAYSGVGLSAAMALLFAALIGVTVPERLRQSQLQQEAATQAIGFTFHRAQLEYRSRYGTYAASPDDLKRLPDADGSIAQAVAQVSERNYRPWSVQAAAPGGKTLTGAKVRPVSARVGMTEAVEGVSFTNYELRLPGPDKQMNTEDDWILRDGVMMKVTAAPVRAR